MRVLVVYESLYGTNLKIAQAIAGGFGTDATITILEAEAAPAIVEANVDLIIVGGPNHKAGLPSPTTRAEAAADADGARQPADRGLAEWLAELRLARPGQPAGMWDTRMAAPRILDLFDRSASTITKRLRRAGARLAGKPQKYFSADGVGTLLSGEEERARSWGTELADLLRRGSTTNPREPW